MRIPLSNGEKNTCARYVVTNDAHFDILKQIPWPKVDVITLKDFMQEKNN